jgi:dihydrofolate synthase / folylpolyglutamate synthase
MKVTPIKTERILPYSISLFEVLDKYIKDLKEYSVVAIASKVVAICEGRVVKNESENQKDELAKQEVEFYLPREFNQRGFMITINHNMLVASGGVDESNGNGFYILWPKDPQKNANEIRDYLSKKFKIENLGVIITDSALQPLRWGVRGYAIAHSGFKALKDYVGAPDIFGRIMRVEKTNVSDSLATAAVLEMGEGDEQQPLAIIDDLNIVEFQKRNPTKEELEGLKISIGDDVFSSFLSRVDWQKGGKS